MDADCTDNEAMEVEGMFSLPLAASTAGTSSDEGRRRAEHRRTTIMRARTSKSEGKRMASKLAATLSALLQDYDLYRELA